MPTPVAYCLHDLTMGGAERHLLQVFRNLDRRSFQPILFCLGNSRQKALHAAYKAADVPIIDLGFQGTINGRNLARLWQAAQIMRQRRVQIVHGYLFEGNIFAAIVSRLAGIPASIASKRSMEHYSQLHLTVSKWSNRLVNQVTANSNGVKEFVMNIEGCPKEKILVIPNGVGRRVVTGSSSESLAFKRQWSIPPNTFVIGTVARFSWKKGPEYFLKMAAHIIENRKDVRFVAIGDGPLRKQSQCLAEKLGIAPYVIFTGWQTNVRAKMRAFDIYVCASIIEGMSNALLEAMAEQLPVVATAVGGNKETVMDGLTGLLTPPKNPLALAEAVMKLLNDQDLLRKMGKQGEEHVLLHHSLEVMVRRMENLYIRLLNGNDTSSATEGIG